MCLKFYTTEKKSLAERAHESATFCKIPYLSDQSYHHCRQRLDLLHLTNLREISTLLKIMMSKLSSFAVSFVGILLPLHDISAFAPSTILSLPKAFDLYSRSSSSKGRLSPLKLSSSPFADATEPIQQVDVNGKVFSPGNTVAVASDSVKAYQVPKAAFGSFDPITREFSPQDKSNASRGTNCLMLPQGLRGEVLKVYDVNEWDRTHPILVKFEEGMDRGEGGYDVPKTFMMHFDAHEIMVLD